MVDANLPLKDAFVVDRNVSFRVPESRPGFGPNIRKERLTGGVYFNIKIDNYTS